MLHVPLNYIKDACMLKTYFLLNIATYPIRVPSCRSNFTLHPSGTTRTSLITTGCLNCTQSNVSS